jgi:hypothetical protein
MNSNNMPADVRRILIVWGEPEWTVQALHLACALVGHGRGEVVLAKMTLVGSPLNLGMDNTGRSLSRHDRRSLADYHRLALGYETTLRLASCQYSDRHGGVMSLVRRYRPLTLFVEPAKAGVPGLARWREWWLRRAVERAGCQLETLTQPPDTTNWVPSVSVERR